MPEPIRAGIIGCDTSHCTTFAKLFHDEKGKDHVPGVRIVAAYPSFSKDIASSADRVEGFTKQLETDFGVKITKSIDELVGQCDAFLIESVDGRRHRPELEAVAKAGKPVFVDKPFAASLVDAKAMVELARQAKIPCFSASSLRFNDAFQDFVKDSKHGKVFGCDAHSPAHLEPTNPGFYWYG
ncbi:MAG: Gfo/Idh/MocA family oxidoreductase, partial [Phycisphaerae bacterium]|nr:Gfo/Idh/MocA family oxidoreductase [Phycisphaerae bacterium]